MNSNQGLNASRRVFLKQASALSLAGMAAPLALNMAAMANASAATASDYKALVCICLNGGNDYANTVVAYDPASHALYQKFRGALSYGHESLAATALAPGAELLDRAGVPHQYALAPQLAKLLPIFDAGELGVLLNIGTLVQPTTKVQYNNGSVKLPPRLLSHNDQQSVWQSSQPEGATSGWGGRMADLLQDGNANATFTCINVYGNAVFLSGNQAVQYQVTPAGTVALAALQQPLFGSSAASSALRALMTEPRLHMLENEYNRMSKRSVETNESLTSAMAAAPALKTPFPAGNLLADQLRMVARMIGAASALGARRQVFFVQLDGFDTHTGLLKEHPPLLAKLGEAMAAFHAATAELAVAGQVTTFTASDFGRSMTVNTSGSDHGWGSMQFIMGGAVKGKRFYGTAPVIADGGPDDIGGGRLLPSTSVDQLAATLGAWMGVSDSELLSLLPNLSNYNSSVRNLGFV